MSVMSFHSASDIHCEHPPSLVGRVGRTLCMIMSRITLKRRERALSRINFVPTVRPGKSSWFSSDNYNEFITLDVPVDDLQRAFLV
jgi:hypothetical protein